MWDATPYMVSVIVNICTLEIGGGWEPCFPRRILKLDASEATFGLTSLTRTSLLAALSTVITVFR